jgi:multidrug transporter EmrE-like cation transporter
VTRVYLTLSVAFNVFSYLLYKGISGRQMNGRWYVLFVLGLILGAINVFFFTKALRGMGLSIAYPIFSGACIFFMVLLSHFFFGERVSTINMIGAALVVAGIALMSR